MFPGDCNGRVIQSDEQLQSSFVIRQECDSYPHMPCVCLIVPGGHGSSGMH